MVGERASERPPTATDSKAAIIADFRASIGELKCVGSERLVRHAISMTQRHVMHLLERHGELPMSKLAEMLDASFSNATGLIDRIEERGYVERVRVPSDRRIVLVRITPAGRAILDEVDALRSEAFDRVLGRLDASRLQRLATAMADLREAITAAFADPAIAEHHAHHHHGRD
jgi:MarR family transcriptional regulator, transcriptional regulator for hemolysin